MWGMETHVWKQYIKQMAPTKQSPNDGFIYLEKSGLAKADDPISESLESTMTRLSSVDIGAATW